MRYGLLFVAIVATAQQPDPRGFVNERLLRQNFAKNALNVKPRPRLIAGAPEAVVCAVPLIEVPGQKNTDPRMAVPPGRSGDEKMIVPTIPVCGKR